MKQQYNETNASQLTTKQPTTQHEIYWKYRTLTRGPGKPGMPFSPFIPTAPWSPCVTQNRTYWHVYAAVNVMMTEAVEAKTHLYSAG